ncbi:MAG: ArnT family glycosyltransferase [Bradymonadaceae bacterium]
MSDQTADDDSLWPGWRDFWESKAGLVLATILVAAVGGMLLFGNLSNLGVWEPWEANDILVAQEYQDRPEPEPLSERGPKAPSYNWAVPTKNQKPIARSLLKTWLVSWSLSDGLDKKGEPQVGKLEFSARLPLAAGAMVLLLVGFFWLRDIFDTWSALLATAAVASTPAVYFGVHTISSEVLFIVTTSLAVIAFQRLAWAEGRIRYLWGGLFGAGLALAFLDQRFVGLLIPMATITAFGLSQLPFRRTADIRADGQMVGTREIILCIGSFLAAAGVVAWGFARSWGVQADTLLLTHVKQRMAILIPSFLLLAGLSLAWRTRVVRRLRSPAGLLGLGIAGATAAVVLQAYSEANPTLLKHGKIVGDIPALGYALQNDLFGASFKGGHLHFAMWIRQIGFSMVPWAAFAPLGVGYLARATRLCDDTGAVRQEILSEAESTKRLLLVWSFVGVVVIAGASIFKHYYFPAYFPLLAGVGLMFGDREFWQWARAESLLNYFMGFAAIAIMLMLAKDLERFPPRLIESYMLFEPDVGLPENYDFGELIDRLKYTWAFVSMTFFFGLVSWLVLTLRDAKTIPKRLWNWLLEWWSGDYGQPLRRHHHDRLRGHRRHLFVPDRPPAGQSPQPAGHLRDLHPGQIQRRETLSPPGLDPGDVRLSAGRRTAVGLACPAREIRYQPAVLRGHSPRRALRSERRRPQTLRSEHPGAGRPVEQVAVDQQQTRGGRDQQELRRRGDRRRSLRNRPRGDLRGRRRAGPPDVRRETQAAGLLAGQVRQTPGLRMGRDGGVVDVLQGHEPGPDRPGDLFARRLPGESHPRRPQTGRR